MSLRWMLDGFAMLRAEATGTPAPWDDFWYNPIGAPSSTGIRVDANTAKRLSTVLSCVNKISKTVAMLPLKIYLEQPDGGKKVATNHPIYDLLYAAPNEQQTAFEFRQMMQGHLELRGNAYAELIEGPRGAVDQMVPMHPDRVTPQRLGNGRVRYRYNDPSTNTDRYLAQEEVFHLRNFMDDGVVGQSTIGMAVDTIGLGLAAQDYYARFLKNDARPGFFLTGGNFKTNQDRDQFRDNFQTTQTGENRHKAAVLPLGMDIKTIGVTGKDAELLEARKFSRIEICSIFDVPPHLIGETEKTATYASVEQFNIMFATFCILPRLVLWEQAIQRSLITSDRFFAKFSMGALLRGDTASRFNAYKIAIENSWMNQDEVRIEEDMNPIPGGIGSHYWRPLNWARLEDEHVNIKDKGKTPPEDDTEEQTSDSSTANPQESLDRRFLLLAAASAERCHRKEMAAMKKIFERRGGEHEIEEFYEEHGKFIAEVMRVPIDAATTYCHTRSELMSMLYRDGHPAPLETDADVDAQINRLTNLAIGGTIQ